VPGGPPAVSSNDERSKERLEQYCQSKNDDVTTPGVGLSDEVGVGEDEDERGSARCWISIRDDVYPTFVTRSGAIRDVRPSDSQKDDRW